MTETKIHSQCFQQNYTDYINQKQKEMLLFGTNLCDFSDNESESILKFIQQKREIQATQISDFILKHGQNRNTNRDHQKIEFGRFNCSYEYQRYDMEIKQDNYLNFFYDYNSNNYSYLFTNCGMSSLFPTFLALLKNGYYIDVQGNYYCETERMLDNYMQLNKSSENKKKALFVDTSCFDPLEGLLKDIDLLEYDAFIVDTTIYTSEQMLPIIKILEPYQKMIFLLRSHTKLDMLGAEWSRLGSICLLHPPIENLELHEESKKIYKDIDIILAFIGGFAYPDNIPLIWNHPNFKEINNKRIKNIRINVNKLFLKLKNEFKDISICKPYHDMFIIVRPFENIDYTVLEPDIHTFVKNAPYDGLLCCSDSFGLDYYALSGYYENMAATSEVIRIAPTDFPECVNQEIIDEITRWIGDYIFKIPNYELKEDFINE